MDEIRAEDAEVIAKKAARRIVDGVKELNAKSEGQPCVPPEKMYFSLVSHFITRLSTRFALKP